MINKLALSEKSHTECTNTTKVVSQSLRVWKINGVRYALVECTLDVFLSNCSRISKSGSIQKYVHTGTQK